MNSLFVGVRSERLCHVTKHRVAAILFRQQDMLVSFKKLISPSFNLLQSRLPPRPHHFFSATSRLISYCFLLPAKRNSGSGARCFVVVLGPFMLANSSWRCLSLALFASCCSKSCFTHSGGWSSKQDLE